MNVGNVQSYVSNNCSIRIVTVFKNRTRSISTLDMGYYSNAVDTIIDLNQSTNVTM